MWQLRNAMTEGPGLLGVLLAASTLSFTNDKHMLFCRPAGEEASGSGEAAGGKDELLVVAKDGTRQGAGILGFLGSLKLLNPPKKLAH